MRLAKIANGLSRAVLNFVAVGAVLPYVIESFSTEISTYVPLPPPGEVWAVFVAIGAAFAVTGFLQHAYSKGEYPWLAGKLASGIVDIALFTYAYSLVPQSIGSASGGIQASDLLYLVYLAIALPYGYLVLDFFEARRNKGVVMSQAPGVSA
jgi:hypothetical protein